MKLQPVKVAKVYPELETSENKVYFVNFPMVQAEVLMMSKGMPAIQLATPAIPPEFTSQNSEKFFFYLSDQWFLLSIILFFSSLRAW